jgi:hypothetical protein
MWPRRTVAVAVAVLAAVLPGLGPAAFACCSDGFSICGTAAGDGEVRLEFSVNGCRPEPSTMLVSAGQDALAVCQGFAAAWAGQCSPSSGDCLWACYPRGGGCWVLLDDENCPGCRTAAPPESRVSGITVETFAP